MALLFGRRRAGSEQARRKAVLDLMVNTRALLRDCADAVVSISDHDCVALGCRDGTGQTTILVLRPDQPAQAFKIDKPIEAVTPADLATALAPLLVGNRASAPA
jgi:hypothetical protein